MAEVFTPFRLFGQGFDRDGLHQFTVDAEFYPAVAAVPVHVAAHIAEPGLLHPGDDDGSFINAGFPWAVLNIGSMPYADPNYHLETDTPDKVDIKNAELTVRLTLAAILYLDTFGRPD